MDEDKSSMDGKDESNNNNRIKNLTFDFIESTLSCLGPQPVPLSTLLNNKNNNNNLTKKYDQQQVSNEKSVESINNNNQNLEYYDDSDYSVNIANAVANILSGDMMGDIQDSHQQEIVVPPPGSFSEPKKLLKQKNSKLKIRRAKSTLAEKHSNISFKPLKTNNINRVSGSKNTFMAPGLGSPEKITHVQTTQTITIPNKTIHSNSLLVRVHPPPGSLTKNPNMVEVNVYLARIQEYINKLGYQRQGEPKIHVHTHMSMKHQTDTARLLIRAGEPIKCLHALVLAIYFTNCTPIIERFTMNFKSNMGGKEYKHVVLGVYMYGFFGSLGISRDVGLQDKPIAFPRLSDLVNEYKRSYTESGHVLNEVRIGGIITHDPHSLQNINWKLGTIGSKSEPIQDANEVDKIAKSLRLEMGAACLRQLRAEMSPPLSIPASQTRFLTHDLSTTKSSASGLSRIIAAKKASSKIRGTSNNLSFKKKPSPKE